MATFSVGLQGIKTEDVDMVEQLIMDTFKECHKKGFDKKQVEAYLHQTELNLKHVSFLSILYNNDDKCVNFIIYNILIIII